MGTRGAVSPGAGIDSRTFQLSPVPTGAAEGGPGQGHTDRVGAGPCWSPGHSP
jgi:hypothetical protein